MAETPWQPQPLKAFWLRLLRRPAWFGCKEIAVRGQAWRLGIDGTYFDGKRNQKTVAEIIELAGSDPVEVLKDADSKRYPPSEVRRAHLTSKASDTRLGAFARPTIG